MSSNSDNSRSIQELTKEVQALRIELVSTKGEIRLLTQEIEGLRDNQIKGLEDKVKFLQTIIFSGIGLILTSVGGAILAGVIK